MTGWTSGEGPAGGSMSDSSDFQSMVGGQISMTASEFGQNVSCAGSVLHLPNQYR